MGPVGPLPPQPCVICIDTVAGDTCDDGNPCTEDECVNDCCKHTPRNGELCDDDYDCTIDDVCYGTSCRGTPMNCDDGNPCTIDSCNQGRCQHDLLNCDDGNPCTVNSCDQGPCVHDPVLCEGGDDCTIDTCVAECVFESMICPGNGNECMAPVCVNGACTLQSLTGTACIDDGNPCTSDVCNAGACTHPSNSNPCASDGNVCTNDVCSGGACTHLPTREFTGCNDGEDCTINDRCNGGQCHGTGIQDCYDGNPCTDDICYGPGNCSNPFNTRPCNDANECTTDDTCTNGTCVGIIDECPDLDPCQSLLECDPSEGCIYDAVCNDENNCTMDSCGAEGCKHTEVGCTGFVCDDPGTPNTGETEIFGQLEWSTTLQACNANSVHMPVLYRIVTHDTPRSRVLSGKLSLSLISGDPSIVQIMRGNQPYSLDTLIPVTILGHFGCGLHDYHDGTTTFEFLGFSQGEVTLKASMDPGPECCEGDGEPTVEAQITITVNEIEAVDLDIEGSFDSEEETAGGYISLYEDEDDLKALTVSKLAGLSGPGTVTLNCESGCSNIQLYRFADRSMPVGLPQTWLVPGGGLPATLYVEGVSVSGSARDVQLKLEYSPFVGAPCEDVVRMTVVQVDLDVDSTADEVETTLPGIKVATNNDFDEGNTDAAGNPLADYSDVSPVTADGTMIATNGLIPLSASILPEEDDALQGSTITITQTGGTGQVRLLAIRPGAVEPFDDDWVAVPMGPNLRDDYYLSTGVYNEFDAWIEPLSPGAVELTLTFSKAGTTCEDKVFLNVVEYAVVEIMYKTFIQCEIAGPTLPDFTLYDFFRGDNRTFGYSFGVGASRTYQRGWFSVNPAKPDGSTGRDTLQLMGITQGFDDHPDGSDVCLLGSPCSPGGVITCGGQCSYTYAQGATPECTGTTTPSDAANLLPVTPTRVGESHLNVAVINLAQDQCETFVPGIDVDLLLEFRQVYNTVTGILGPMEFRASGSYDGYPWHELYLNGSVVFLHDPCVTGEGPLSMGGSGEHFFNGSGQLPEIDPSQTDTNLSYWQSVPNAP